jgi:hypothetical protein
VIARAKGARHRYGQRRLQIHNNHTQVHDGLDMSMVNGWMGPRKYCLYGCFLVLLQIICVIFMNINDFSIVYSCFLWEKDDEGVVNRKQFWHHPVKPVQIWRPKIKTTTMCQMLLHKPMTVYIWLLYRTFYFWKW